MSEINHRYLMDKEGDNFFPITHTDAVIGIENIATPKKLEGKNIVMFGDSNTELGNYPELVAEKLGANVVKAGFYGCRMAQHPGNTYLNNQSMQKMVEFIQKNDFSELVNSTEEYFNNGGRDYRSQAKALNNVDWNTVDIITVFFGGNDFGNLSPLGTDSDMTGATFKGAINKIIKIISETLPYVRLIFITPMFRSRIYSIEGENSDDNPNTNGVYFKDYVNAIIDVTKLNHVVSINLNDLSGVNRYNSDIYLDDGKHPSSYGYSHIARIIGNQIELLY
ncbi:MAG TPA: SGNH/GDSL hydrolase family protein [Candidatus Coprovivens excrementavium]|nr:SGNH/GDSL hydrolase family protein [Candidatus Coprovivens excrementavium]